MDSEELSYWMAREQIDPLPDGYLEAGIVASTIANVMGSSKKSYAPLDFMPNGARRKRPRRSAKAQEAQLRAFFMAHNERLRREGKA